MGCADRRWENRFEELPQRAATLRLQWRHIGYPSFTAFPSSAALNPKWSQTGNFALLFLTIPFSAITQKNAWKRSITSRYFVLSNPYSRTREENGWLNSGRTDTWDRLLHWADGISLGPWELCHIEKCPFQRWCMALPEETKVNDSHTFKMPRS